MYPAATHLDEIWGSIRSLPRTRFTEIYCSLQRAIPNNNSLTADSTIPPVINSGYVVLAFSTLWLSQPFPFILIFLPPFSPHLDRLYFTECSTRLRNASLLKMHFRTFLLRISSPWWLRDYWSPCVLSNHFAGPSRCFWHISFTF